MLTVTTCFTEVPFNRERALSTAMDVCPMGTVMQVSAPELRKRRVLLVYVITHWNPVIALLTALLVTPPVMVTFVMTLA
jgi:hypothetical protein